MRTTSIFSPPVRGPHTTTHAPVHASTPRPPGWARRWLPSLAALLVIAARGTADAKPLVKMTDQERATYYGDLLRDLQAIGGEYVTDQLLVRAGPCIDQCPVGKHTFSFDRVEEAGFTPKRDFHYDREAVPIRTRDEKIHDAVAAKYKLQDRTFEIINAKQAAEAKLRLYCASSETFGFEDSIQPIVADLFVIFPFERSKTDDKERLKSIRDRFAAYVEACDFKKLDLFPNELQLVRLERELGLKRKAPDARIPVAEQDIEVPGQEGKRGMAALLDRVKTAGEALRAAPEHLLAKIVGGSLVALTKEQISTENKSVDLLQVRLLQYMVEAAEYMANLCNVNDVATYDELGLTYEHLQDLIYVYLAWTDNAPSVGAFQAAASEVARKRIEPPPGVELRTYPTQSGMDGFAMAYVAAQASLGFEPRGRSYFPATTMPLGEPVLEMDKGIYFETRFLNGGSEINVFATGLATEFDDEHSAKLHTELVDAIRAREGRKVLVIDDTLVAFDNVENIENDYSNTTSKLIAALRTDIAEGNVDVILVRSLQKFGSLGTRKVKAGFITVYSSAAKGSLAKIDKVLAPAAKELFVSRGPEFRFLAFNMRHHEVDERRFIRDVAANVNLLAKMFRYNDPKMMRALRTFVLTNKLETRAQAFRAMPQFGTFGGPYASHSDLGDVERFSPGLEPPDVLGDKLRFLTTNVPRRLRLRQPGEPPLDFQGPYPSNGTAMTNRRVYDGVGGMLKRDPTKFVLYQGGRKIDNDEQIFDFDFSKPEQPADLYVIPVGK
jgi:hypothetical protein